MASLAALVLVASVAVALVGVGAGGRLRLFPFALAVLYLAIASQVALHADEALKTSIQSSRGARYHYGYGAYLGVAAVAVLAAAFLDRARLARSPSNVELIALLSGAGLLVAFFLPWTSSSAGFSRTLSFPGARTTGGPLTGSAFSWARCCTPGTRCTSPG